MEVPNMCRMSGNQRRFDFSHGFMVCKWFVDCRWLTSSIWDKFSTHVPPNPYDCTSAKRMWPAFLCVHSLNRWQNDVFMALVTLVLGQSWTTSWELTGIHSHRLWEKTSSSRRHVMCRSDPSKDRTPLVMSVLPTVTGWWLGHPSEK